MTIHKRRGSGTWWAWLGVAIVLAIAIAGLATGLATID
jgi:hypothetical protein